MSSKIYGSASSEIGISEGRTVLKLLMYPGYLVTIKRKGKSVPVRAVKAYKGSGGKAPLIFMLGTKWRWVFSFMSWPLYTREGSSVRIYG
jgi:hypothetical protein